MGVRLTISLVAAVAFAVLATGCGSDDGSEANSSSDPSSAEVDSPSPEKVAFVKRANAVCLRGRETTLTKVGVYKTKHQSEGLSEAVLTRRAIKAVILATLEREINALQALEPPAGEEEQVDAMLAAQQATFEQDKKLQGKMSTAEIEARFADSDKDLRAYGLTGCTKSR